jgi:hypothetical protein
MEIAQNNGQWYRVSTMQMRYFPMKHADAVLALATGDAIEVPYLPFGRGDLWHAYVTTQKMIKQVRS